MQDRAKDFCRIYANFAGHVDIFTIIILPTILTHQGKKCRIYKIHAGQGVKLQDNPANSGTVGKYAVVSQEYPPLFLVGLQCQIILYHCPVGEWWWVVWYDLAVVY